MTNNSISHDIARALEKDYSTDAALIHAIRHLYTATRFQDVVKRYDGMSDNALKYLNVTKWLPKHLYLVRALNLHAEKGLRIWDLGCGPGWFSWLTKELGHHPLGLDTADAPQVYTDLCNVLEVPVTRHSIQPFVPLPQTGKYDLVILLMASFYIFSKTWDAKAWDYFLSDIDSRLNPNGTILFELNNTFGYLYTPDIFDVFVKHDYKITRNFCIKSSTSDLEQWEKTFFAVSRKIPSSNSPFAEIWRYLFNKTSIHSPIAYIEQLEKEYPYAADVLAHKALLTCLAGDRVKALALLGKAVSIAPDCVGYAIAYCQMLFLNGERLTGLRHISAICRRKPDSVVLHAWLELMSVDENTPLSSLSPYWKSAVEALEQSSLFSAELTNRQILSKQKNPAEWYLRFGAMALGLGSEFTPILYWGLHHDVFLSGMDPLVHYIMFGHQENREY